MMCTLFNVSLDDLVKGDVKRMGHEEVKRHGFLDVDDVDLDFISLCFNRTTFILFELVGRCDYLCYFFRFYSSTQVDKIKYRHGMDNYDRIVAFMNGQDPNEVQTSKTRNLITSILSFVFVVGAFVIICWLSIYLSFKFYRNQLKDLRSGNAS